MVNADALLEEGQDAENLGQLLILRGETARSVLEDLVNHLFIGICKEKKKIENRSLVQQHSLSDVNANTL